MIPPPCAYCAATDPDWISALLVEVGDPTGDPFEDTEFIAICPTCVDSLQKCI